MNIAFCINRIGLAGLGVTVSSLLQNCSRPEKLKLYFLCAGLTEKDKNQILRLLVTENFSGKTEFANFDPKKEFGNFASLHGDWTNYGRLLLPDIVKSKKVLYLDADLVVEVDVLEVENLNLTGVVLGAVGGGCFRYSLGNKFYIGKLAIDPDKEYFNDGVMLINIIEWNIQRVREKCMMLARKYPLELPSHEQSLLNIFCMGKFAKLPDTFNCSWEADKKKPQVAEKMIIHFIGSPKPWDPFGFIIHNGYGTWKKYLNNNWKSIIHQYKFLSLGRVWHLRRSYARTIINKIQH